MNVISQFILIEHLADRAGRHFDLRFRKPHSEKWDSFATRREMPPESGKRILLFKTTVHTEKEALFTGEIPKGEYGAGTLTKVDEGECIIKKYKSYHIIIEFKGKKLNGSYQMYQPQGIESKFGKSSYLFFKVKGDTMQEKVNLSENALSVAKQRYFMDNETWENFPIRVATPIAEIEKNKEFYREKFSEMIYRMDFLGGGRILRNSGRQKGTLLNCYHLPCGDSIEEIGEYIKNSLILWSEGGGVGCTFSTLRPKGDPIKGKGGVSTGTVSFIEAADSVSRVIESGGARRAAGLASLSVSHPDIFEFIDAKIVHGTISHFNISVEINNDFLDAVREDKDWNLVFNSKVYNTVKARQIWEKIVSNMVKHAEPGILNYDNLTKNNSYYFDPVTGCNPCHTGDTLVYVADGRSLVSFKQLVEEEKDVPVFCLNKEAKRVEVQMMRNPRKTGFEKIYKVYLDDGTFFRSNGSHKVTMVDGSEKRVIDLLPEDRLHHLTKYQTKMSTLYGSINTNNYIMLNSGWKCNVAEHRVIAEFKIGRPLLRNETVHHEDFNYQNNAPDNLKVMLKKNHDDFHRKDKLGSLNPIHRFPEKNYFKNHKFIGLENGNCAGKTIEDLLAFAVKCSSEVGRRLSIDEWKQLCRKNNYPYWSAFIFQNYRSFSNFLEEASKKAGVLFIDAYHMNSYNRYLKIRQETELDVFFDGSIKVRKKCETCSEEFIVPWQNRERCFCSSCNVQYLIKYRRKIVSNPEEVTLNFKVVKIEEDGYEDVYNGTVDKHHNYYVYTGDSLNKAGKVNMNFINSMNCGEAILAPYESCDLGSIVLPNFISENGTTNWDRLKETIFLAVRFLDNVLDVNKFTIEKINEKSRNSRRIGVGVMGLAEYLFRKQTKYGSEESLKYIAELMSFIRDNCYLSSIKLAKEKGPFPKFDRDKYLASDFIQTLPKEIQTEIYNHGIRNVTLMAIAPTGTISLIPEVTNSIEPLFSKAFIRRDRVGNRVYIHPLYERLLQVTNKTPDWFVDTQSLKPIDHITVQGEIQKFVDGATSKTINLPKGITKEELSELLLNNLKYLKGVTVYVDGSRVGQIQNHMNESEVISYLKKNGKNVSHSLTESESECVPCSREKQDKSVDMKEIKDRVIKDIISRRNNEG